jgi:hypothetical protein
MSRIAHETITCDKCGREYVGIPGRDNPQLEKWGRVSLQELSGKILLGTATSGGSFGSPVILGKDLCAPCVDDLVMWWNTMVPVNLEGVG